MNLLSNCSQKHAYPWLYYTVKNYFDSNTLDQLLEKITHLQFNKSMDRFREEYSFDSKTNDSLLSSIIETFLCKENIDFLSNIDNRIKNNARLLRASIWKDYPGFNLPIHTDSYFKLFTMQIYLPRNEEKDYGTTIYDQSGTFVTKTDYTMNNGYFFFPNINKVKTNHSFVENIKTERCSLIFNVFDKEEFYNKKPRSDEPVWFLSTTEF